MVVGQLCRQFGGDRQAQSLAQALAATLPIEISEASSTQNDLVVSFFSVTCIYFVVRVQMMMSYRLVLPAILAAGLAFHTKGTAALFIFGFAVVYAVLIIIHRPPIIFWRNAIIACLLAAAIVGGFFSRNLQQFGTLLGPSSKETQTVEPNWRSTTLNAVRNVASNLYFPQRFNGPSAIGEFVILHAKTLGYSEGRRPLLIWSHAVCGSGRPEP